jgi:biotin operon repressor
MRRRQPLPPTAIAVHAVLRSKADHLGTATVSRNELARMLGCSMQAARMSLRRLRDHGLIDVEHNCSLNGRILTNTYYVRREG